MIAASHGQNRGNRLLTSTATASSLFILLAPATRIERVLQVMRVRWIDAKRSAFYVLQRSNIHFGGEQVAHRQQPIERINKFAGLDFFDSVEQEFSSHGRAGQADCFQDRNFTTA